VLAPSALLEGIFVEKVFEDTEQLLDTLQRVRPLLSGEIPSAKRVRLVVRSHASLDRSSLARSFLLLLRCDAADEIPVSICESTRGCRTRGSKERAARARRLFPKLT